MAANPEDFRIEEGVLTWVSDDYIKKNNGYFEIPNSVTVIGTHAFSGCTNIKSVIVPDSVKKICEGVLYNCKNLKSISIHDSVEYIGMATLMNGPEDQIITIIANDPYAEKAENVKNMFPKFLRVKVKIEFGPEVNQAYVKGDSSALSFFSQQSNPEGGEPSSNNQHKPGA